MPGDFAARIDELLSDVGDGDLTGRCEVDQIYARYQHEGVEFRHPEGGQAKYLEQPHLQAAEDYMRRLAKSTLEPHGLVDAMADNMEHLSRAVYDHAPFEFGDLRASGHPTVEDDGHVVYDRPPLVHRLTEDELKAKDRVRDLGFGH